VSEPYEILCPDTRQLERPAWLSLRKQGLGSSDAAPAMGMSPWTSRYSLWAEKRGLLAETPDNERFLWGRLHEENILNETQRRGWVRGSGRRGLMVRSIERPWMIANPDGLWPEDVVEAKTADGWDEPRWQIGVPDPYVIQGHHLMIVTGRRRCVIPVLFGGNNLVDFYVEWDQKLADSIIEAEHLFWHEHVLADNPPDPDGSEATMLALRQVYTSVVEGKVCDLPDSVVEKLNAREYFADLVKRAEVHITEAKATVMDLMGDAETAKYEGDVVATWKADRNGRRRFLWKEHT
jgi:putative phage-type endonuclease